MKKEFVVLQISADTYGKPGVMVSMIEERYVKRDNAVSLAGLVPRSYQLRMESASRVALDLVDYSRSGIRVGDKVCIEISKIEDDNAGGVEQ